MGISIGGHYYASHEVEKMGDDFHWTPQENKTISKNKDILTASKTTYLDKTWNGRIVQKDNTLKNRILSALKNLILLRPILFDFKRGLFLFIDPEDKHVKELREYSKDPGIYTAKKTRDVIEKFLTKGAQQEKVTLSEKENFDKNPIGNLVVRTFSDVRQEKEDFQLQILKDINRTVFTIEGEPSQEPLRSFQAAMVIAEKLGFPPFSDEEKKREYKTPEQFFEKLHSKDKEPDFPLTEKLLKKLTLVHQRIYIGLSHNLMWFTELKKQQTTELIKPGFDFSFKVDFGPPFSTSLILTTTFLKLEHDNTFTPQGSITQVLQAVLDDKDELQEVHCTAFSSPFSKLIGGKESQEKLEKEQTFSWKRNMGIPLKDAKFYDNEILKNSGFETGEKSREQT